jgi:hypothetical protein
MKQKLFSMKKISLLILIIISVAAIQSCKKKYIPGGPGNTPKDVYVAGLMDGTGGGYWKNETYIPGFYCTSIAVSGSDVYVVSGEGYRKNGNIIPLEQPPYQATMFSDIVISGSDVYVVVHQLLFCNGGNVAKYWKNGRVILLTASYTCGEARAIAVSGSDVYVAGGEYNSIGKWVAKYWKNGNPIPLTDGSIYVIANGIAVSGNDVYVAGFEWNGTRYIAKYWKNGNPLPLTDGSKWSETRSIAVSGSDVYVLGFEETTTNGTTIRIGKYWKNGTAVTLAFIDGSRATAEPYDITVSGNDVYVAGSIAIDRGLGPGNAWEGKAVYWKNGTPVILGNGYAYGIAVVP